MRRRRNLRTCPDAFGAYGGTLRPLSAAELARQAIRAWQTEAGWRLTPSET
jgi:hypothetical protein